MLLKFLEIKKSFQQQLVILEDLKKIIKKIKIFDELKLDFIKFGFFVENRIQMIKFTSILKSCNFKTELVPVIFVDNSFILENALKNLESFKALKFNFFTFGYFLQRKMVTYSKIVH